MFDDLIAHLLITTSLLSRCPGLARPEHCTGDTVRHCDGVETVEEGAHNEATVHSLHSVLVSANLCSLMVNFDLLMTSD